MPLHSFCVSFCPAVSLTAYRVGQIIHRFKGCTQPHTWHKGCDQQKSVRVCEEEQLQPKGEGVQQARTHEANRAHEHSSFCL